MAAAAAPPPPASVPASDAPTPLTGNLHLSGTSRVDSVRVQDWTASGFTKVSGSVEVATGRVTGSLTVGGRLTASAISFSGSHRLDGDVQVGGPLRSDGTLRVAGLLSAGSAELAGSVVVGKSLQVAEDLRWSGMLEAGQDARAHRVFFRGRLAIPGTLAARSIVGEVDTLSTAGSIQADWVEIRRKKSIFDLPLFILPPRPWHELEVQRIEAAEVHLAGVRVRRLKADRIWLGPHTHAEYVEGTIVAQHKEAHVGPESESPPPPGLSR